MFSYTTQLVILAYKIGQNHNRYMSVAAASLLIWYVSQFITCEHFFSYRTHSIHTLAKHLRGLSPCLLPVGFYFGVKPTPANRWEKEPVTPKNTVPSPYIDELFIITVNVGDA